MGLSKSGRVLCNIPCGCGQVWGGELHTQLVSSSHSQPQSLDSLCCLHNKVQSSWPDLMAFCHLALLLSPVSPPLSMNRMILLILLGHSPSFPPPDIASCFLLILWYPFPNVLPLRSPLSSKGQVQDHLSGRLGILPIS